MFHYLHFQVIFVGCVSLLVLVCHTSPTSTQLFYNLSTVDAAGDVCISILHEPGDDKYGYETAAERWLPIHTVETICISVISMLADPNTESPANVDAAVSQNSFYQH